MLQCISRLRRRLRSFPRLSTDDTHAFMKRPKGLTELPTICASKHSSVLVFLYKSTLSWLFQTSFMKIKGHQCMCENKKRYFTFNNLTTKKFQIHDESTIERRGKVTRKKVRATTRKAGNCRTGATQLTNDRANDDLRLPCENTINLWHQKLYSWVFGIHKSHKHMHMNDFRLT